jgi:hypothetical protein
LALGAQHRAQAAGDDLLRLRDHALYDLSSRQDRVNQASVLANQQWSIIYIACDARDLGGFTRRACVLP